MTLRLVPVAAVGPPGAEHKGPDTNRKAAAITVPVTGMMMVPFDIVMAMAAGISTVILLTVRAMSVVTGPRGGSHWH